MASLPGSDFGGLSEGGFDDKGSEASGPVAEQISFDLSKPCTCALCQKTSVSESPLTSSHLHDKHGSRRPWSSYRKVFDKASGATYRVPQSKLCSLCRNVWKLLGFSHKYGNIAKYVKMIAEKRVDHAVFLASLDEWIKKHNANPNKHRLRNADDKDSVRDAKEKLVTKDEHGCEFEAPDMFFVEVDNWKPEYGPLEEAKIEAFDSCFCHLPGFAAWLPSRRALCDPDPFPGKFGTSSTGTRVALRQAGETKGEGR